MFHPYVPREGSGAVAGQQEMSPGEGAGWHEGTETEAPARGAAAGRCCGLRPARSSPPAHAAHRVTLCHRVSGAGATRSPLGARLVLCLQATSQLPAWPEPSSSLVERFRGLAARRLLAGFQQHRGRRLADGCLPPPGPLRTASPSSVSPARADRCQRPLWWCQGLGDGQGWWPPAQISPLTPPRGSAELRDQHCRATTTFPATSVPMQDRAW